MASLRVELFSEEDPLMLRRVVQPGKLGIAELRVELGRLEREGVEPGGMAAERERMPFGIRDQAAADPAPAQIRMHPKQVHEQPAGVAIADQAGPDRCCAVADENAEIRVARVAQKRRVVAAKRVVDEFAVGPARLVLEAEPKSRRQFHWDLAK